MAIMNGVADWLGLTNKTKISTPKVYQVDRNAYTPTNYDANRSQVAQEYASAANRVAPTMAQTTIDQSIYNQSKNKATGLYDSLSERFNKQLAGETQSLAELEFKSAQDRAIKQTQGAIGSQAGLNPAVAARMAAQNMVMSGQINSQDAAKLAVQEEQRALENQMAVAQGFGQVSAQDAALAQAQANLTQGANIQNQNATLQQTGLNDQLQQYFMTQQLGLDKYKTDLGVGYQQDRQQGSVYDATNSLAAQRLQSEIDAKNQEAANNLWGQITGAVAYKNGYAGSNIPKTK